MARKHLVTRTVKALHCVVLVCNLATHEVSNIELVLPRAYNNEKDTVKAIEKSLPDGYKYLTLTSSEVKETLYGMDETDFIQHANVMPPRTSSGDTENTED